MLLELSLFLLLYPLQLGVLSFRMKFHRMIGELTMENNVEDPSVLELFRLCLKAGL